MNIRTCWWCCHVSGISLERFCSFRLTKLGPPAETFLWTIMSSWIFPLMALLWDAWLLLDLLGKMPSFYLGRGCHRENEIGEAARSRSLGFFVDYGCVEIICPLLCQKEFLLRCKISFRELNTFMWKIVCFTECIWFFERRCPLIFNNTVNCMFLFVSECWVE